MRALKFAGRPSGGRSHPVLTLRLPMSAIIAPTRMPVPAASGHALERVVPYVHLHVIDVLVHLATRAVHGVHHFIPVLVDVEAPDIVRQAPHRSRHLSRRPGARVLEARGRPLHPARKLIFFALILHLS